MGNLTLEEAGDRTFEECSCCGGRTRKVWGYVSDSGNAHAVYYARWTDGNRGHGMSMLIGIHGWGEGADESLRRLVALDCRFLDSGPGVQALDEPDSQWGNLAPFGAIVNRENLLASPLAREVFDVVDLVFVTDSRVRDFAYPA